MFERLSNVLLIRREERAAAYYFLLLFLVLGWGTAVGRGTADALFLKRFGIEYLPLIYTVLSPLLVICSIVYAATVDRLSAERMLLRIVQVLGVMLVLCWASIKALDVEVVYPVYFLLYQVASEVLTIHSALYISQNFDAQQAKRLTSPIMAGAQMGAILGGLTLVKFSSLLGVENMLLVWLFSLAVAGLMLALWHRRHGASLYYRAGLKRKGGLDSVGIEVRQGVKLLRRSPLLKVASLGLFFMAIAYYVLSYLVHRVYNDYFVTEESLSSFYGVLVAATSACALLLQLLVTGRAIRRFGVRTVNLYFPVALIAVFSGLMFSLSLPFALLASFSRDTVMPAFRNPVRSLFFHALPTNIQGRARATSLIVVVPMALLFAGALLVFVQYFDMPALIIALGLGSAVIYLFSNIRMNRAYLTEIIRTLKHRLYVPEEQSGTMKLKENDSLALSEIHSGIQHPDELVSLSFAEALIRLSPDTGIAMVFKRLPQFSAQGRDRLINQIGQHQPEILRDYLGEQLAAAEGHTVATAMRWLCRLQDPRLAGSLPDKLKDDNPRIRAMAVRCVREMGLDDLSIEAARVWLALLLSKEPGQNLAALELADLGFDWAPDAMPLRETCSVTVRRLMAGPDHRASVRAHEALRHRLDEDPDRLLDYLGGALSSHDHELRLAAVQCVSELANPWSNQLLYQALGDSLPEIRRIAAEALFADNANAAVEYLKTDQVLSPQRHATVLRYVINVMPDYQGLNELAEQWTDRALNLASLRMVLSDRLNESPIGQLVETVLRERENDYVNLALEATGMYEGCEAVAVIRAALATGNRGHIASAREILQGFRNKALADRLDQLLGQDVEVARISITGAWDRLEKVAEASDEWFRTCVSRASQEVVNLGRT